jgi:hypothetical protein
MFQFNNNHDRTHQRSSRNDLRAYKDLVLKEALGKNFYKTSKNRIEDNFEYDLSTNTFLHGIYRNWLWPWQFGGMFD